jgi:SAM-dependent methyltransferase
MIFRPCPLCRTPSAQCSVTRSRLPIFQNVVFSNRDAAIAAPQARFDLATCRACGFSYNTSFDNAIIDYGVDYDNHVASSAFTDYYHDVVRMLIDRLGIHDGTVYDIGCGKGEFLRIFCKLAPGVRGIGIDPSCTPIHEGNFELLRATFETAEVENDARLVILRHVLEHIEAPLDFLAGVRKAMPSTPLYVEVPDLKWILKHRAFWDFCYEHCNYFTLATLAYALRLTAFDVRAQDVAFGGQYQWALAVPAHPQPAEVPDAAAAVLAVADYAAGEGIEIERLSALADRSGGLVVWGMATKGVLLSILLGAARVLGGIDMNRDKQGRFAAASGVEIHPPQLLATVPPGTVVVVMNPNYLAEINAIASAIRSDIEVLSV